MNYQLEIQQLENSIPKDTLSVLKREKCFIAGGALTSIFTGSQINDIDVYFRSRESLERTMQVFCEEADDTLEVSPDEDLSIDTSVVLPIAVTKKSVVFTQGVTHRNNITGVLVPKASIQFITFQYFDCAEDIFDTFDFTINMCAYDCAKEELTLHDSFLKHLARRSLVVNTNTAYPLISMLRVDKYRERGYNISTKEQFRLMLALTELNLESWEDVKDHIGGMYGYDVENLFNESQEFSVESAIEQLGKVSKVFQNKDTESVGLYYIQWRMQHRLRYNPEDFQGKWFLYTDSTLSAIVDMKQRSSQVVKSCEGEFLQIIQDKQPSWRTVSRTHKNMFEIKIKNLNKVIWSSYVCLGCYFDNTNMEIMEQVDLAPFEALDLIRKC